MSTLNDRDRHLLNYLERQLQQEDPAGMHRFKNPEAPRKTRRDDLQLATAMGLLVLLAVLCLLLGIPVGAVIFGSAVIVVAYIRYRRWRCQGGPSVDRHQQLPTNPSQPNTAVATARAYPATRRAIS